MVLLGVSAYKGVVIPRVVNRICGSLSRITAYLDVGMQLGTVRPMEVVALNRNSLPGWRCNAPVELAVEQTS